MAGGSVRTHRRADGPRDYDRTPRLCGPHGAHLARLLDRAGRIHPGAGQGVPGGERDAPGRREPRAHRGADDPAREDGARHARRRAHDQPARLLDPHREQHLECGRHVRDPGAVRGSGARPDPRLARDREAARAVQARAGSHRRHVRGAAGGRARQHGRLQAAGAGSGRRGVRRPAGRGRDDDPRRERTARAGRSLQQLPRGAASTLSRRRPGEGEGPRRLAGRRLLDAPDLSGIGVRQRLHALRPQLAGERPGRRGLSRRSWRRRAAQGPQSRRRHGAAGDPGESPRHHRTGHREPLQHVPLGRDRGRHAAGRQLGSGDLHHRRWRERSCRRR